MADEEVRGFGETLRSARESAGLTIEDVAHTTRISARYLTAMEEENWSVVPGAVIGRGFVRVVAKEIGADPVLLLEAYKRSRGSEDESPANQLPEADWKVELRSGGGRGRLFLGAGIIFLLLLALMWFWPRGPIRQPLPDQADLRSETTAPLVAEEPAGEEAVLPRPVPEPATPVPSPAPPLPLEPEAPPPAPAAAEEVMEPDPGPHTLQIQAVEKVWVRVSADGGENQDSLLEPGERKEYQAEETFRVRLGNAASVRLFWNGTALKVPGDRGEVLTLQFPEAAESLQP